MKQVLQDLQTGQVVVADTPDPSPAAGRLLVKVQASLLSAGTESAQVAKARQSLVSRIRQKPELIRKGLDELRERGMEGIKEKLASKYEGYAELGYSCAGLVVDTGQYPEAAAPGTLVACGGTGIANHAEFISVPVLLTAAALPGTNPEAAAYAVVGAIAMQGVRQANTQLGEYVAVIGLGLVGLLTTQILRAAGCIVAGVDPSPKARERGLNNGCDYVASPEEALDTVRNLSGGMGADVVIICAATADSSPLELAGRLARSRGRVIMVGATGMTVPRDEYYLKELSLSLSRSYGPGRYDRHYEEDGRDYPIDYVRFTEQRNMRAFLELVHKGAVDPTKLTTHRFPIEDGVAAYSLLADRTVDRAGVLLTYSSANPAPSRFEIRLGPASPVDSNKVGIGFVGAGAYAQATLLPLLKKRTDVALRAVMTRNGSHALHAAKRFGFETSGTRMEDLLANPAIHVLFITTRHDSHAELTCRALRAGKHVWVEKPLALTLEELRAVAEALRGPSAGRLIVGFNRPFAPSARWLMGMLPSAGARLMHYRVNAGYAPPESWVHDPKAGGGRLLGEGCHFFDFLRHVAGSPAASVHAVPAGTAAEGLQPTANFVATVRFANGAVGQLIYSSQGASGMGKEHFECFVGQSCGALLDYRDATFHRGERTQRFGKASQDKGQNELLEQFLQSLRQGSAPPMSPADILESSLLTLAAQQSLLDGSPVSIDKVRKLI